MNGWADSYSSDMYLVLDADDSTSALKAYFETNSLSYIHAYGRDGDGFGSFWNSYGYAGGYPHNVLFDRDGNVRRTKVGAITSTSSPNLTQWEQTIKECVGVN